MKVHAPWGQWKAGDVDRIVKWIQLWQRITPDGTFFRITHDL